METSTTFPALILGFGNLDRQDDGVAWHILARLAARLGRPFPRLPEEFEFDPGQSIDFFFSLQLVPEMAEVLSRYKRVCFIDAHTGAVSDEVHVEVLTPQDQGSPFTHHLTAAALLNLSKLIYADPPQSILISVRGYEFNFSQDLSPAANLLADQAVDWILTWLNPSSCAA
jgi:hydrogenase maturation protease